MLKPLSIGTLQLKCNIFIAPLAGYTNLPTRLVYREQGAGIAYAEMVSAQGLHYNFNKSVTLIDSGENDSPLGIQLFGSSRETIVRALEVIKNEKFDVVDINCGCSVKKIINSGSGASLLKSPDEVYKIIKGLKELTDKPVTLKIRSGWDHNSINYKDIYYAAESACAALITLHPRTKTMLFDGKADWSHIAELKKISTIPVIGNGDIFTADDAVAMFNQTQCDGIMLARGVMENPFLIEEIIARFENRVYIPRTLKNRLDNAALHCKALIDYTGDEVKAMVEFRKFFKGYAKGGKGITHLRQAVNQTVSYSQFVSLIAQYLEYSEKEEVERE